MPRLRLVPAPDDRPPIVPPDEIFPRGGQHPGRTPFVQGSLALDFPAPADSPAPLPTRRSDLPDPPGHVRALTMALLEVLAGRRPAGQLARLCSPDVYAAMSRRAALARQQPDQGTRRILRVRCQEPTVGVLEASAVVVHHGRVRALAMRLVGLEGRWVLTDLVLG